MEKAKGLSKEKTDRQLCSDYQRERRWGKIGESKEGIEGDGRRLVCGW